MLPICVLCGRKFGKTKEDVRIDSCGGYWCTKCYEIRYAGKVNKEQNLGTSSSYPKSGPSSSGKCSTVVTPGEDPLAVDVKINPDDIWQENFKEIKESSSAICRTCLLESNEMHSLYKSIEVSQRNEELSLFLRELTNLEYLIDDGLPIFICQDCVQSISNAISFKEMCLRSDYILRDNSTEKKQVLEGVQEDFLIGTTKKEKIDHDVDNFTEQFTINDMETEDPPQGSSKENLSETSCPEWMSGIPNDDSVKAKNEQKRICFGCGMDIKRFAKSKWRKDLSGRFWCIKCHRKQSRLRSELRKSELPGNSMEEKIQKIFGDAQKNKETPKKGRKSKNKFNKSMNILQNSKPDKSLIEIKNEEQCVKIQDAEMKTLPQHPECPILGPINETQTQSELVREPYDKNEEICYGCGCKMELGKDKICRTFTGSTWCYKCYKKQKDIRQKLRFSGVSSIDEQVLKILKERAQKNERPTQFKCNICGKVLTTSGSLKKHQTTHSQEKPFECSLCGKYFKTKFCIQSHMMCMHLPKKLQCSTCSMRFSCAKQLKNHDQKHIKPHLCTICGKRFTQITLMKRHIQTHSTERIFKCDLCEKTFNVESYLRFHRKRHFLERRFECHECGKKFKDNSILKQHTLIHTNVRPYACTFCDKRFNKSHHLNRHMYLHTGEKRYTCPICPAGYIQIQDFKRHMMKHKENGEILEWSIEKT